MNTPEDDVDFVTMHNILYYIYVGCVNLPFPGSERWKNKFPEPADFPSEADAFQLYKSSKKFLVSDLSDHCLRYLKLSLTPCNVSERLFNGDNDLQYHDEVVEAYIEYLLSNYDKVKVTDTWKESLRREYGDDEGSKFGWSVLCQVTENLVRKKDG